MSADLQHFGRSGRKKNLSDRKSDLGTIQSLTQIGHVRLIGQHSILCGDSLQLMRMLGPVGVCVITDPPYRGFDFDPENYLMKIRPYMLQMLHCSGSKNRIAISQPQSRLQEFSSSFGFDRMLVIPDAFEDDRGEDAYFLIRNPLRMSSRIHQTWSGFASTDHPNSRNINKMAVLIDVMTESEDTILDPFCGSGAIGLAAVMLGRNYIGIELLESRAEDARRRFDALGSSGLEIELNGIESRDTD